MGSKRMLALTAGAVIVLLPLTTHVVWAKGEALTGIVSSDAEGKMEGVVVTAKKPGSIVEVSVTTDAQGRYSFPDNRLDPGDYTLSIRAVGYDIVAPARASVQSGKMATSDITLKPTKNLASQLTNAEWMMSVPGPDDMKVQLINCQTCHTLERIVRSTHNVNEFMQVLSRMAGHVAVDHSIRPQRMREVSPSAGNLEQVRRLATYLASINLSQSDHWSYELKTLPRPKGRDTRVIVTEYDLKRQAIQPHDVIVDKSGVVWYTNFGEMFIGKFDPKTLKHTEIPVKTFKDKAPTGLLNINFDRDGKLWFDTMYQGALGMLDPKTGEITYFSAPPEYNDDRMQLNFAGLHHDVDGKVWTKSSGTQDLFRIDIKNNNWEKFHPTATLTGSENVNLYEVMSDSKNNAWVNDISDGHLGKIDAKTKAVTWYSLPTQHARLRRMNIDAQDRITVAEFRGNKVARFDSKTEKFTEYALPPLTYPYRANFDKNGEIWASTMSTDRVVRVNPATGQTMQYLMPAGTNMRSMFVDNSTRPVTFWVGSNHDHRLVRVEPLD
jgi:virginiamycin B lyase